MAGPYVYLPPRKGDPATVGFYDPNGQWHPESDHPTSEEAAERVHWLNGGGDSEETKRSIALNVREAREAINSAISSHVSSYHAGEE